MGTDYRQRIDTETWAFVRASEGFAGDGTVAGDRAAYDAMARAFHAGRPAGVEVKDALLGGVPVRRYLPPREALAGASVLYLHGGGHVLGGLESHDDVCAEICAQTGLAVVAADYRLAPEHRHPAGLQDCVTVARGLLKEGVVRLVLAGDSAGGNLAAGVAHTLRGEPRLTGMVLIYPGLGGDTERGSYLEHAEAPMLTRADVLAYEAARLGGAAADLAASPLRDTDFSGLPPVVTFAAECDPLADDAHAYAEAVVSAGGWALCVEETGLVHGYLRARHSVGRARESFGRITSAITALARGEAWRPQ